MRTGTLSCLLLGALGAGCHLTEPIGSDNPAASLPVGVSGVGGTQASQPDAAGTSSGVAGLTVNSGAGAWGGGAGSAGDLAGGGLGGTPPLAPGHGPGTKYELSLDAPDRPVRHGDFVLYVPDGLQALRGIIVHQHGCGRSGIEMAHDLHWQALADRYGMALLGSWYPTIFPDGEHCDRWSHIENGSDELFIAALSRFAGSTGHAELSDVPWVLWGHSGGASWAFQMTKKYASKVAALVLKSICEKDTQFDVGLLSVPTLLATGNMDLGQCYPITTEIFQSYRVAGAPWTYVDEPNGTHDCAKLRLLAIPYLDAVLQRRLARDEPEPLRPLLVLDGLLADGTSPTFIEADSFTGDATRASFLPDAATAQAWYQFLVERTVSDATPPTEAPESLRTETSDGGLALHWFAEADVQSGIAAFNVYQDGALWRTLPDSEQPFQNYNYGDEPEPAQPPMRIEGVAPGHDYQVTSLNAAGLESPRSEVLHAP